MNYKEYLSRSNLIIVYVVYLLVFIYVEMKLMLLVYSAVLYSINPLWDP